MYIQVFARVTDLAMRATETKRVTHYKSRGATLSPQSRYLARTTERQPDGWEGGAAPDEDVPTRDPRTELLPDRTVKLLATNKSPDIPFDQSINPYKGCEHGCVYCFARPTHAYLDLSPGLDFELSYPRRLSCGNFPMCSIREPARK